LYRPSASADGPGDDHVVVEPHEALGEDVGEAEALEHGGKVAVDDGRAHGGVLAQHQLQQEGRDPDHGQHEEVGDEEDAAAVLVAEEGEPPDVAEAHRVPQGGQQEVQLAGPRAPQDRRIS